MFDSLNSDTAASFASTDKDTVDRVLLAISSLQVGGVLEGFSCRVTKTDNNTFTLSSSSVDIGELIKSIQDGT